MTDATKPKEPADAAKMSSLDSELDSIRKLRLSCLSCETLIQLSGTLMLYGWILMLALVLRGISHPAPARFNTSPMPAYYELLSPVVMLVVIVAQIIIAIGLLGLGSWVRRPALYYAFFWSVLCWPSIVFWGCLAFLLTSETGAMILSPAYRDVIRLTPNIHRPAGCVMIPLIAFPFVAYFCIGLAAFGP